MDKIQHTANLRVKEALDYLSEEEVHLVYEGLRLYTKALNKSRRPKE